MNIHIYRRHIISWHISVSPATPAQAVISVEIPATGIPSVIPERVRVKTHIHVSKTIESTIPIGQLYTHSSVEPNHIIPDVILLPAVVVTVCHVSILFFFNTLQFSVQPIGLPVGQQAILLTFRNTYTYVPVPVKLLIIEVPVVVISLSGSGGYPYHHQHQNS